MTEPTQIRPLEEQIVSAEKIIKSLLPPTQDVAHSGTATPSLEPALPTAPSEIEPLTWEEVVPSPKETKEILYRTAIWIGSLALVTLVWILGLQLIAKTPTRLPLDINPDAEITPPAPTSVRRPRTQIPPIAVRPPLRKAAASRAVAPGVEPAPQPATPAAFPLRPVSGHVTARFYSPVQVEVNWDFVGEGYRYRLYSATSASMAGAQAETPEAIISPHMTWTPRQRARDIWLAVSAIDPQNHEGPMSAPLHVLLPPEL